MTDDAPEAPKSDAEVQAQLPPRKVPPRAVPAAQFSAEMTVAIVVIVASLGINGAVYLFAGRSAAAYALSTFTIELSMISLLATLAPREVGHLLPALAALVALFAGTMALQKPLPPVLGVSLVIYGVLMLACAWQSWMKVRIAWAFLLALSAVMSVVLLFGAPKVRNLLEVQLWEALIIPGLLAGATIALAMVRLDYAERSDS